MPRFDNPQLRAAPRRQAGLTLVELMIALVLGLVIVGAATAVYLGNRKTYTTNQALSRVQTQTRMAYLLMARAVRQAGATGCGNSGRIANVLNGTPDYALLGTGIKGYDGGTPDPAVATGDAVGERVAGTSAIRLMGAGHIHASVGPPSPGNNPANLKLNAPTTELHPGDIIVVCNPDHATVVQITNIRSSNTVMVHNTGQGNPGNCSKGLGFPTLCTTNGNAYQFPRNAQISKLSSADWYIGHNPAGGRSLYRLALVTEDAKAVRVPQEMVRGITDLQVSYHLKGQSAYGTATAIGSNWGSVDSVYLMFKAHSDPATYTPGTPPLLRQFAGFISLRNRLG